MRSAEPQAVSPTNDGVAVASRPRPRDGAVRSVTTGGSPGRGPEVAR